MPAIRDETHLRTQRRPALLAALAAGDEAAFATIYAEHAPAVRRVARRVTGDTFAAEEICQEVFTQLWTAPDRFDPDRGTLEGWLAMLAYRRGVDWVRRELRRRRPAVPGQVGPDTATATSAEEEAIAAAIADRVRAAVSELPASDRQLVHLLYFEGQTVRELAERLGLPEGTAKTRLQAARRRLARRLGSEGLVSVR